MQANKPYGTEAVEALSADQKKQLESAKTKFGVTLDYVVKSGTVNPDSQIGMYAGDIESYSVFKPVFDYVIKKYHKFDPATDEVQGKDAKLVFTEQDKQLLTGRVQSSRIRVARNLADFPFPSAMNKQQREDVEKTVLAAIAKLPAEFQGKYYAIRDLPNEEYENMVKNHLLFKCEDKYLETAGIQGDWPTGRGAYISNDKNFMVWINEEDHMRIIYLAQGADFNKIYQSFTSALDGLAANLNFAQDPKLGHLTSCPTNIGTTMRASVHIKLEKLGQDKIKEIAKSLELSVRGTHGEHTEAVGGVYDISNQRRLGKTREQLICDMIKGVIQLVNAEQAL